MKLWLKSLFLMFALAAVLTAAGCLSPLSSENSTENGTNQNANVSDIYNISVFVPTINNTSEVVESGSYDILETGSVQVIRLVDNKNQMPVIEESGFLVFSGPEIKDVYFLTTDNFSMTQDSLDKIYANPVPANVSYTLKSKTSGTTLEFDQNFSGIVAYTLVQSAGENKIVVDDGAKAVLITLPPNTTTGNRILGTASPKPDTIGDEDTREVLEWNAPTGNVSVKYYNEKAPMYMIIAGILLAVAVLGIYLYYQRQIRQLQKITRSVDPDGNSGFRKQRD
ncbi:DUF5803 family protein [Methanolapillus millepedarum]|uniref:Uncharacterized protein n=1 Tax=Methanolapillus millepedarum TaxID=3028296 RepID=A0AA96VFE9_9EURY|nr:hypothetical protein MsAc7_11590 [Methanosarcinaceae archaeon Ac7]